MTNPATRKNPPLGRQPPSAEDETRKNPPLGRQPPPAEGETRKNPPLGRQPPPAEGETRKNPPLGRQPPQAEDETRKNSPLGRQPPQAQDETRKNPPFGRQPPPAEDETRKNPPLGRQPPPPEDETRKNPPLGRQPPLAVLAWIDQHADLFRTQGAVVQLWRTRRGRRIGPYYHLKYREQHRQHTLYLGPSPELAAAVREKLAALQEPHRWRQTHQKMWKASWAAFRQHKKELARVAAGYGITLKGWEFRGVRRYFAWLRAQPLSEEDDFGESPDEWDDDEWDDDEWDDDE
jgi:hypothetical protein